MEFDFMNDTLKVLWHCPLNVSVKWLALLLIFAVLQNYISSPETGYPD